MSMRKIEIEAFMGKQKYIIADKDGNCYVNGTVEDIITLLAMIFNTIIDVSDEFLLNYIIESATVKALEIEKSYEEW